MADEQLDHFNHVFGASWENHCLGPGLGDSESIAFVHEQLSGVGDDVVLTQQFNQFARRRVGIHYDNSIAPPFAILRHALTFGDNTKTSFCKIVRMRETRMR
jgi:hypothetical protein